tara:strand:- start:5781 stop:6722 length:942 start_codon:yes stop_codon:yes gene_type:complete
MGKLPLHITNGTNLTTIINQLGVEGEKLTWEEMLCEGPTSEMIDSEEFLNLRKSFFNEFYDVDLDIDLIKNEMNKLNHTENYSEIVLWFEYDLFCHINMIAVISLIHQKKIEIPIYLVCSGRIEGSKNLKALSELTPEQLMDHYENKVLLDAKGIDLANTIWGIYCGIDHNLLKPFIVKSSSFEYLSNCLKAHLKRFPDSLDGLNVLEKNILEIINKHAITSKNHLLGYALNYQGFYGYGHLQLSRIIDQLSIFFTEESNSIVLNRKGHEALLGQHNFASEIDNNMMYGGVKKFDFQFNKQLNKLVKTIMNAH